jgi:AcrR family transcriptional regulator
MKSYIQILMNKALFLKDPEQTELGKKIVKFSIHLILKYGFESFTFKKLAFEIGTTEASVYRYFENKHNLLVYLNAWYWSWLEYQIGYQTNNISDPIIKLKKVITLLVKIGREDENTSNTYENLLHQIVITEGSKAYLTKQVTEDNRQHFFKPYKDLIALIGNMITEINSEYPYPKSLGSTLFEMAHYQYFFMKNLPSLTDFNKNKQEEEQIIAYLNHLIFSSIQNGQVNIEGEQ